MNVQIIIPVFNPGEKFERLLISLKQQTMRDFSVLIIDSGSDDLYKDWIDDNEKISIKTIRQSEFNHGRTRQLGIDICPDKEIYVFFTQDAILVDAKSLENIVKIFDDRSVGCAYGRQIPHADATEIARLARLINYPNESYVRSIDDRYQYGIKTVFMSNTFAAYRHSAIEGVGGFPGNTILCEDMWVTAKMVLAGWKVAYVSNAMVYHSHNYTIWQEFKRYFDIGVFHARECWIKKQFCGLNSSGVSYIKKEMLTLLKRDGINKVVLFFEILMRDFTKLIAYKLGSIERCLPLKIKQKMSMNKMFWK